MVNAQSAAAQDKPLVLVDTVALSEEEWLAYRRRGIGGSDVAAILGISPFRTARDLYYDKLNIASAVDEETNWVALEVGHRLEDLVAQIFQRKTGFRPFQVKKRFQNPAFPFMLADVDFFVALPDGSHAILEIKTTNYNAQKHWWRDRQECVPAYYESQVRHYMAVMDMDRAFLCCLYGNTEDEVFIRELRREKDYESEMIFLEQQFWTDHVLARRPPPYTESGELVMESVQRHYGDPDENAPAVQFTGSLADTVTRYLELQEQKRMADAQAKRIGQEIQRVKGLLIAGMNGTGTAFCAGKGEDYVITYKTTASPIINKDGLLRLKLQYPEIYEQFVTTSRTRRFRVQRCGQAAA